MHQNLGIFLRLFIYGKNSFGTAILDLDNNITNLAEIFAEYEEAAHRPKADEASGQLSKKR